MPQAIIITIGLSILAYISGMIGLGVAFAAIPFLSFFFPNLVSQVHPLTLLLNGVTALFAVFGFAKSGYVEWKKAIILALITTITAPIGAYLAHLIPQIYIWIIYFISVSYLAYRLFKPIKQKHSGQENFTLALILAVPIPILSGLLGVGPGFFLMPTLILVGFEAKKAAAINAFAVCPPSFSAILLHLSTAKFDVQFTLILLIVGALASFFGARTTSLFVPGIRLKQIFGSIIVIMTLFKIYTLF